MKILGFSGTAKNTGKTTAAVHLLGLCDQANLITGLTSIGFDGENKDHITGLPKPRYDVLPGTLVATAEPLLDTGSAKVDIIQSTGIMTIMGPIVIARVTQPGNIVLAGPNRKSDLLRVIALFQNLNVDAAFLDGALNRLIPMACAEGLVISTGASLNTDISWLAMHAKAMVDLLDPADFNLLPDLLENDIQIIFSDGQQIVYPFNSLLGQGVLQELVNLIRKPLKRLVIPGACDVTLLKWLVHECDAYLNGVELGFGSPLKLIASGDPISWDGFLHQQRSMGRKIIYKETVPLLLITVNPFFPRYNHFTYTYEPDSVDKDELLKSVDQQVNLVPVVDVFQSPLPDLLKVTQIKKGIHWSLP